MSDSAVKLPKLAACNFTALRMASRRVTQLYDAALAPTGIKVTQMSVLATLERTRLTPPSINELAGWLAMDRSSLGQILRPLERDGLLEMSTDPDDARVRRIALTAFGRRKLEQCVPLWEVAQRQFESRYGSAMASAMREMLYRIALDTRDDTP